ncbi:hypothetical protein SISNIDRAFT_465046 [Sistotremastrum niveocremeum HHB9708]|uniref:Uncharacterized protein n=1 Tax=Sistotremastrum niveocremeum HHB9708 TaxID=1314777 RepID=A0A164W674_9AGAM|nr:hypothetical protein SISNIDRAFT_465046 [Sistotremastrum niveocremeum HHB9708]
MAQTTYWHYCHDAIKWFIATSKLWIDHSIRIRQSGSRGWTDYVIQEYDWSQLFHINNFFQVMRAAETQLLESIAIPQSISIMVGLVNTWRENNASFDISSPLCQGLKIASKWPKHLRAHDIEYIVFSLWARGIGWHIYNRRGVFVWRESGRRWRYERDRWRAAVTDRGVGPLETDSMDKHPGRGKNRQTHREASKIDKHPGLTKSTSTRDWKDRQARKAGRSTSSRDWKNRQASREAGKIDKHEKLERSTSTVRDATSTGESEIDQNRLENSLRSLSVAELCTKLGAGCTHEFMGIPKGARQKLSKSVFRLKLRRAQLRSLRRTSMDGLLPMGSEPFPDLFANELELGSAPFSPQISSNSRGLDALAPSAPPSAFHGFETHVSHHQPLQETGISTLPPPQGASGLSRPANSLSIGRSTSMPVLLHPRHAMLQNHGEDSQDSSRSTSPYMHRDVQRAASSSVDSFSHSSSDRSRSHESLIERAHRARNFSPARTSSSMEGIPSSVFSLFNVLLGEVRELRTEVGNMKSGIVDIHNNVGHLKRTIAPDSLALGSGSEPEFLAKCVSQPPLDPENYPLVTNWDGPSKQIRRSRGTVAAVKPVDTAESAESAEGRGEVEGEAEGEAVGENEIESDHDDQGGRKKKGKVGEVVSMPWIVEADGVSCDPKLVSAMGATARDLFDALSLKYGTISTFGKMSPTQRSLFYNGMETLHPQLQLCRNQWKVSQHGQNIFNSWKQARGRKETKLAAKEEPAETLFPPATTTESDSASSLAPLPTKRSRQHSSASGKASSKRPRSNGGRRHADESTDASQAPTTSAEPQTNHEELPAPAREPSPIVQEPPTVSQASPVSSEGLSTSEATPAATQDNSTAQAEAPRMVESLTNQRDAVMGEIGGAAGDFSNALQQEPAEREQATSQPQFVSPAPPSPFLSNAPSSPPPVRQEPPSPSSAEGSPTGPHEENQVPPQSIACGTGTLSGNGPSQSSSTPSNPVVNSSQPSAATSSSAGKKTPRFAVRQNGVYTAKEAFKRSIWQEGLLAKKFEDLWKEEKAKEGREKHWQQQAHLLKKADQASVGK